MRGSTLLAGAQVGVEDRVGDAEARDTAAALLRRGFPESLSTGVPLRGFCQTSSTIVPDEAFRGPSPSGLPRDL